MSEKRDNVAYFSDGHTELITEFEISKDGNEVWFTVESGRWFLYREELVYYDEGSKKYFHPECKFYTALIDRSRDEFGMKCNVRHLVTDEIDRIRICSSE